MAAPNLRSPTTVTGKTELVGLTTSLGAVLSNGLSSGKVLKVNTVRAANISASNATVDLALVRTNPALAVTRSQTSTTNNSLAGDVGVGILGSGFTYWHKNDASNAENYTGTVLEYLVGASLPVSVLITVDGTPTTVEIQGIVDDPAYVRLDHSGFTTTSGVAGSTWVLSLPGLTSYLLKGGAIDAGKTLITTDKNEYVYLEEGDGIHAKASASDSIDLTINYEEIS